MTLDSVSLLCLPYNACSLIDPTSSAHYVSTEET